MREIIFLLVICSARFTVAQLPGEWVLITGSDTGERVYMVLFSSLPEESN